MAEQAGESSSLGKRAREIDAVDFQGELRLPCNSLSLSRPVANPSLVSAAVSPLTRLICQPTANQNGSAPADDDAEQGPPPPPAGAAEGDDDSDDDFGPMPMPAEESAVQAKRRKSESLALR